MIEPHTALARTAPPVGAEFESSVPGTIESVTLARVRPLRGQRQRDADRYADGG